METKTVNVHCASTTDDLLKIVFCHRLLFISQNRCAFLIIYIHVVISEGYLISIYAEIVWCARKEIRRLRIKVTLKYHNF